MGGALALLVFTLFRFDFARFLGGGKQKVKKAAKGLIFIWARPQVQWPFRR